MTSLVGVLCKDGVVIGADSASTFSAGSVRTIEQPTEKIFVHETVIVASTGSVGLHQRFTALVERAYDGSLVQTVPRVGAPPGTTSGKVFTKDDPLEIAKILCRAGLEEMGQTYSKPGSYGALVGFPCRNKPQLCEFSITDFQPELKNANVWYVSMGSAQPITDPFLGFIRSVFWESGPPSVSDAIFAVTWTLQHAIELNTGGVQGPIRIAALEQGEHGKFRVSQFEEAELAEHLQNIVAAKKALRDFRTLQRQDPGEAPALPTLGE